MTQDQTSSCNTEETPLKIREPSQLKPIDLGDQQKVLMYEARHRSPIKSTTIQITVQGSAQGLLKGKGIIVQEDPSKKHQFHHSISEKTKQNPSIIQQDTIPLQEDYYNKNDITTINGDVSNGMVESPMNKPSLRRIIASNPYANLAQPNAGSSINPNGSGGLSGSDSFLQQKRRNNQMQNNNIFRSANLPMMTLSSPQTTTQGNGCGNLADMVTAKKRGTAAYEILGANQETIDLIPHLSAVKHHHQSSSPPQLTPPPQIPLTSQQQSIFNGAFKGGAALPPSSELSNHHVVVSATSPSSQLIATKFIYRVVNKGARQQSNTVGGAQQQVAQNVLPHGMLQQITQGNTGLIGKPHRTSGLQSFKVSDIVQQQQQVLHNSSSPRNFQQNGFIWPPPLSAESNGQQQHKQQQQINKLDSKRSSSQVNKQVLIQ
ncbi:hypothetical protein FGO68_gene16832 [Halteria grandinella]|uniref:Uncharacterized protein n=1 Tax=Halteria grandinella TaxID=5974 RepID=A0A8J8P3Y4_HALGN|nr:hypothetical protein FGO68_gene16832 [Halteria grandinella]